MAPASPVATQKDLPRSLHRDLRTPVQIRPKPLRPRPAISPTIQKKPRLETVLSPPPSPPSPPSRRRAPALERLPRWLFAPVKHFVSPQGELPLPRKVAVRGKPFYDWDAWAIALLDPILWRKRGPWHRLCAGCAGWKPPSIDRLDSVKSALVRIVVAEVVSRLVHRSGDHLTPEDRNWITSVASRQRGRDPRKPTLMLLFDLAFPLFDLASYCRCAHFPSHFHLENSVTAINPVFQKLLSIVKLCTSRDGNSDGGKETIVRPGRRQTNCNGERESSEEVEVPVMMDPLVVRVLRFIDHGDYFSTETSTIEQLDHVLDATESILDKLKAPRWYKSFASQLHVRENTLKRAALSFARCMPLSHSKSTETKEEQLASWARQSFVEGNWAAWAELANDFSFMSLNPTDREATARSDLCDFILELLLSERPIQFFESIDDTKDQPKQPSPPPSIPPDLKLMIRRFLDVAIILEQFFSQFVETHGNESASPSDVSWMVSRYERLVQELNAIRDLFITSSPREKAMVEWASHALDVSGYYRDAVFGSNTMAEDMQAAVQSAFSEASWSAQTRAMRYMVQQPCVYPKDALDSHDLTSRKRLQFWITSLDLRDPVYLAAAIVPWDPNRSLRLLDEALSINDEIMDSVRDGKEGLPLWDFRRIAICRLLLSRGNFAHMALIMERLQILFNRKTLHEGGNFSARTIPILEAATRAGNVCAQTTLGLLLAGEGQYWEVARSWAGCEKSTSKGVEKLYLSAVAGDLEACTALSHVWAQCGSDDTDAFKQVSKDQVYALFKIAVTSQNAAAVLNLGVIWRYGVSFIIADMTVAIDAFLMALQGARLEEARVIAAKHLSQSFPKGDKDLSNILSRLRRGGRMEHSSASSPNRIDDYRGSN